MTEGRVAGALVRFSLPLFVGNLFQQFYSTVDSIIVGNVLGKEALAALGSTAHLTCTVISFFTGLAAGTGVVMAQAFGARDRKRLRRVTCTAFYCTIAAGLLLGLVGFVVAPGVLSLIAIPADIFPLARDYLAVYFLGLPCLLMYDMAAEILRATGNSRFPLLFLVISSLVNGALDMLFVVVMGWGVRGAAAATVLSEAVAMLMGVLVLARARGAHRLRPSLRNVDFSLLGKIARIGLPDAIVGSLTYFSNTFMQRYINWFGAACVAGWAAFARYDQLAILPMTSIAGAASVCAAQNYGAGNAARIRRGLSVAQRMSLCCMVPVSAALCAFAPQLVSLFNADAEVVRYGSGFLRITAPFYVLCSATMIFCFSLQGLGRVAVPLLCTFCTFAVFRQVFLLAAARFCFTFPVVASAYPLAWPLACVFMCFYARRVLAQVRSPLA